MAKNNKVTETQTAPEPEVTTPPENSTLVTNDAPTAERTTMLGGYLMVSTDDNEGWEDKSLPPMIKPKDFGPGMVLIGRIIGISSLEIPENKKLGGCITLETKGGKCAIPITTVLEKAISVKGLGTTDPTTEFIGYDIRLQSLGAVKSAKRGHRDFWNFDVKIRKNP